MWTRVRYNTLRSLLPSVNETHCVIHRVTCDLFSSSFNFRLKFLISAGWCCTHDVWGRSKGSNHKDSCPVNMVARTTYNSSALKIDSTGHGYQTHHAGRPRRSSLYVSVLHPAGKMLTSLVQLPEWPERVHFQLLQVPMICYGDLHKDRFSRPLLADCSPHGAFCRIKWRLHNSVCIFRGPESHMLLLHEPIDV
jgi:hypothetical protein